MSGLLGGVLPAIYSQADRAKRYLGGLLSDPVGRIQQAGGQAVDDLNKIGLLSDQAFSDPRNPMKMQDNAASRQLVDTYLNSVMNFAPLGMNVWHGSPHKFDKFDSSKIGTGEGAQAYGHGLYLAESKDVAKGYKNALSPGMGAGDADTVARVLKMNGGDLTAAADDLSRRAQFSNIPGGKEKLLSLSEKVRNGWDPSGALYKVDLPDDAIAKMLDWDKPMSNQSAEVRKAWQDSKKLLPPNAIDDLGGDLSLMYGPNVSPQDFLNTWESLGQRAGGEAALRQLGVPGVRYLDGSSRGAGSGTSNFVVFPGNESILSILERNGQPLR